MLNLKTLIEEHDEWLTDRVVRYAQQKSYIEYTSTLREAWRISICGLSKPLVELIDTVQSAPDSRQKATAGATEFGISQGLKHRSLGVELHDFVGLLKLYRRAYIDLVQEKDIAHERRDPLQQLIIELFDSIELGIISAWSSSNDAVQLRELQKTNRELSNEKNKYLTVFESIAEPAILLGPDDKPTHVNAAANRLLLGEHKPGAGYYGELDNPMLHSMVAEILNPEELISGSIELKTANGKRHFNVAIQQMLDVSEKFAGQVIVLQDVTDYLQAIDAAQAADRAKSVFLATISHEIRTPINSILGLTGLLEDADLPLPAFKHIRGIRVSGEMLSALIENVLGLSRAETNALQLVEQDFNLHELCDALFQVLELRELDRGLKLEKIFDPDVPPQLHGDSHKLRHVLLNLLSNSLKYTEHGKVTLSVSVEGSGDRYRPMLRFEIADTGIGVRPEDVDDLFEPFSQGAQPISSAVQGSGLGLAISKHLVEFMGGQITYRNNPGGGSIFSFAVRMACVTQPQPRLEDLTTGKHVLVVEDDPVNAIVLEGYLRELGNDVVVANGYQDAIQALETADFDVVVTDYKLRESNGLDVAGAVLRIGRRKGNRIPVIVATAALPKEALNELQKSNVSLFLEKPFSRYQLANALSSAALRTDDGNRFQTVGLERHVSTKSIDRLLADLGFARCQNVIRSYQKNMPELVSDLQSRLDKEDFAGVSELAHQLISASGFVGAWSLVELTKELKSLCRKADRRGAKRKFAELLHASECTGRELDTYWGQLAETHMD